MSVISSKKVFPQLPFTLFDVAIALSGFVLTTILTLGLYVLRQISGIESVSQLLGVSSPTLNLFIEYAVSGIILAIVYFLVVRRRQLNWRTFGFRPVKFWPTVGWVTLGFLVTFLVWVVVTPIFLFLTPQLDLAESQEIFQSNMTVFAQVLMIIYAVIVGPFIEEVIFRGVVLTGVSNDTSSIFSFFQAIFSNTGLGRFFTGIASFFSSEKSAPLRLLFGIVISTGIWSLLHFQANIIIFTTIFGVVLSYMYYRTQSLWACYLTHLVKNLIAVIALYLIGF